MTQDNLLSRISIDPNICFGKPCIRVQSKTQFWLTCAAALLSVLATTTGVQANCVDEIGVDPAEPTMQRYLQQLRQRTDYPWGTLNPYGTLSGKRITLTPDFELLTGPQKLEALSLLRLNDITPIPPTPEELDALKGKDIDGAMSPYEVFASDGRAISLPYDGCTRNTLLTEVDRYSWYYNQHGYSRSNYSALHNAGQVPWRQVNFPISAAREKTVRLKFWQTVGSRADNKGGGGLYSDNSYWIAWVPEQGYFEIAVFSDRALNSLDKFWKVAPRPYRYVVVDRYGTILKKRTFK